MRAFDRAFVAVDAQNVRPEGAHRQGGQLQIHRKALPEARACTHSFAQVTSACVVYTKEGHDGVDDLKGTSSALLAPLQRVQKPSGRPGTHEEAITVLLSEFRSQYIDEIHLCTNQ